MRFVVNTEPGKVELNFMWAPTFIGMNNAMKKELEDKLSKEFIGQPMTDAVLDKASDRVVELILEKFPLPGLRDYLDAIKFVQG